MYCVHVYIHVCVCVCMCVHMCLHVMYSVFAYMYTCDVYANTCTRWYHIHAMLAPLGVILKDENKLNETVDILKELQKLAPSKSQTNDVPLPNT